MADNTKIEWADATVNAVNGCSVTSPGCTNCYAMRLAGTRMKHHPTRAGLTRDSKAGPVWTGEVRLHEPALRQPLAWKRPRRIFWNAHGDLFHPAVPDEWIDRVFAVCALTPQHTHIILTKRSARMRNYLSIRAVDWMIKWPDANPPGSLQISRHEQRLAMQGIGWPDAIIRPVFPLANVWLGVSIEDQTRADERIPDLLATPAAVRFLSCEPLLGPVDLMHVDVGAYMNGLTGREAHEYDPVCRWPLLKPFYHMQSGFSSPGLDWVIVGGESGPGARPMHPDWVRSLRDQCADAEVPFHFKQWGEWAPICEMDECLIEACYGPPPKNDLEGHGRRLVDQCVLHDNGDRFDGTAMYRLGAFAAGSGAMTMMKVGKKRAGRLIDGVEHNGMPEVRHG